MPCVEGRVPGIPEKCGLYDPIHESDACGVGFVVSIDGVRSNKVLRDAQTMLQRMEHRGACGCDNDTGDGAGVLTAIPHKLYDRILREEQDIQLPDEGCYATGMIFADADQIQQTKDAFESIASTYNIQILAWRDVPVDNSLIGRVAKTTEPFILQVRSKFLGDNHRYLCDFPANTPALF